MTSHYIRKQLGMTQVEFSKAFKIPLATVRNWDARDCMPVYVHEMLLQLVIQKKAYALICEKYSDKL